MKIASFSTDGSVTDWDDEVNEFIAGKKVKNMQMTVTHSEEWGDNHNLVILYE